MRHWAYKDEILLPSTNNYRTYKVKNKGMLFVLVPAFIAAQVLLELQGQELKYGVQ